MASFVSRLACTVLLSIAALACARAEDTVRFDIASQPLTTALKRFAEQAKMQILYRQDAVSGATANAVVGSFEKRSALDQLLRGTGLEAVYSANDAATIRVSAGGASGTRKTSSSGEDEDDNPIRLTQVGPGRSSTAETPASGKNATTDDKEEGKGVPEMLVKGSRVINADIERSEDAPQPYVVFSRADLERSQASNLNEFLKTRLPMNASNLSRSQQAVSGLSISSVDLRGLGQNQTLIVVDGRRMPGVFDGADFGQPDINGIPLAAVERIEVLPSTAGGIYGGGATGGVINIVMRHDFSGAQIDANYGNTMDTDAASRRLDVSAGLAFNEGRTQVRVAGSHSDSNPLLVGDRDFSLRGRALILANNPAAIYGSANTTGYTTNIRSSNGSNLQLKTALGGTPLNSPVTSVPIGYAGPASDSARALVANAGRFNLDLPNDLSGAQQSLLNNPVVKSGSFSLRHQFAPAVEGFLDAGWFSNMGRVKTGFIVGTITLPVAATSNPFTTPIRVRFPETSLEFARHSQSETLRGLGGLIVRLGGGWTAEADFALSRARQELSPRDPMVGDRDGLTGPAISVNTALQNGTLNVMRDLNAFPLDYTPYLLEPNDGQGGPFDVTLRDVTLRGSGPLLQLPGGALTLTALLESREEEARDGFLDSRDANNVFTSTFYPSRVQKVDSAYLEARAPVLRGLEVQASVRRDEYKTTAPTPTYVDLSSRDDPRPPLDYGTNAVQATKFTVGMLYSPLEDLSLRASFGTGFLPASVGQISREPPFEAAAFVVDSKREQEETLVFPVDLIFGGNPDLRPEESESWSAGAIFTPRSLPGLRLSVDYTRVEKTDEISFLLEQQVLDLEELLPGRIVRADLTDDDIDFGYSAGAITSIDMSLVNLARTRVEAYDIQADYTRQDRTGGEFHFYALATWQPHFERQLVPGSSFVDSAGFSFGTLEWRGNAGIDWERGPWLLGWNAQFYDSYRVYTADAPLPTALAAIRDQGSANIPSQLYHDVFARYRFGELRAGFGAISGAELTVGIQNLFDDLPPIIAGTSATGGYSTYADPRLRRYSLALRLTF